ncbi:ATP-binding protein [Mesonia sp.]|uniref:ATP-binding protein n=1 Tax=Mesonia sp. TaxID=1960830 RepID=UPI003F9BF1C9
MRYLNKIIFINSASVKYAEIELDGNVHLIGTQGVGKSTLLRAILFFYNANKTKLGIPREKKGFDEYYFDYQNSYIIYEIVKDDIPFCVLAYKVNGKVAYRFFYSKYKRELFIDEHNRAFESWDKIRNAFGKTIHYTPIVSSYEDFRRIIYGDNKGLKADFRKYALIESKQYQNIPRTIQNVFLNSNLEAQFIKDTIIKSLNEDEFSIDLENYSKNHLRDFESQINDIKIWSKTNKKGQVVVRKQADKIIDRFRVFKYLNREKKQLGYNLAGRIDFIEKEKPLLLSTFSRENSMLHKLTEDRENLKKLHLKRAQKLISEIDYLKKELKKGKQKQADYATKNIDKVIGKIAKKATLTNEEEAFSEEKTLLTSKFAEISQKFEALISQIQNQNQKFENAQTAAINTKIGAFSDNKASLYERYEKVIKQIRDDQKEEREQAQNELELVKEQENGLRRKKAELKYQTFFNAEITQRQEEKKALDDVISKTTSSIQDAKNETGTLRKEWELETKEIERAADLKIDKATEIQQKFSAKIKGVENKIKQSQSSLYGWLNENVPDWENNIGKVIDEEDVLFNTNLNPKLTDAKTTSLFGVELNLNALENRVKSLQEYKADIDAFQQKIEANQKRILQLNSEKADRLQKMKTKFNKKLKVLKDSLAENEYKLSQSQEKLKKNKIDVDEWLAKAKTEKENNTEKLENELDAIASKKLKAQENVEHIKKGISRKISLKETERTKEINTLEKGKETEIEAIKRSISKNKEEVEQRIQELKNKQTAELDDKGADTERLNFIDNALKEIIKALDYIKENEALVIEYNKDKRELFDKIPELKSEKASLEKKQASLVEIHKIELDKITEKHQEQDIFVKSIATEIEAFEADAEKFEEFKKSDAYASIQVELLGQIDKKPESKSAIDLISAINDAHYKGIGTFKELQQATNAFIGNFNEHNVFNFKVKLNEDSDFLNFAEDLKEFVEEDKIEQYEKRVNERFAHIIQQIGNETGELISKEAEIEKVIKKINNDFVTKNFVQAIKEMEMRTQKSSNPIVRLLLQIKYFNDENSLLLGQANLFTSSGSSSSSKNQKAVELLKQLIKELERYKSTSLSLSESFDLQFRIVENDNNSGWVEKLSNVGSEGTDVLVKAMINILLLNVFKESASKKFKDFKVHCMMDEIGRLHPNNMRGILRFANERNIFLINGSPTSQNATDYKYTYKLAKQQSKTDAKKYITKINRLVKVNAKVLSQ